jgi:antitoxin PrlF
MEVMALARSRLTAQGQISIPAEVRRRLGLTPGSLVEWEVEGDRVFIRRGGKYTWDDIHKVLFPNGPPPRRSIEEMDEGIRQYIRRKYARR